MSKIVNNPAVGVPRGEREKWLVPPSGENFFKAFLVAKTGPTRTENITPYAPSVFMNLLHHTRGFCMFLTV